MIYLLSKDWAVICKNVTVEAKNKGRQYFAEILNLRLLRGESWDKQIQLSWSRYTKIKPFIPKFGRFHIVMKRQRSAGDNFNLGFLFALANPLETETFVKRRHPMAATPREKIMTRRKRLEAKQNKIKAFQEKIRQEEKRLAAMIQDQEEMKHQIIGRIMAKRMEDDQDMKVWFGQEIERQLTNRQERDLFSLK